MVRLYKRKPNRGNCSQMNFKNAIRAVEEGSMSVLAAAHSFGVLEATLRRHLKKYTDLQVRFSIQQ